MSCPALYINLDRDVERRKFLQGDLDAIGLQSTRIAGVNGADIPASIAHLFAHIGKGEPLMKPGELGCYASHITAWQHIVTNDLPHALVLEDDASFTEDASEVLQQTIDNLPSGWDFVHLASGPDRAFRSLTTLPCGRRIIRHSRIPFGAGGYLMSRSGAAKMLRPIPRVWPIDLDTRRPWVFGVDAYGLDRQIVFPNRRKHPSTIRVRGGRSRLRRGIPWPTRYTWTSNPLWTPQAFVHNLSTLGPLWWLRCAVANGLRKITRIGRPRPG
jgi:glycosyl transferase, family 25